MSSASGAPGMIGAVDIGGTKIAVGMVDEHGRLLSRRESPTEGERGYAAALNRMASMLGEAARTVGADFTGIGIGSTGPVYPFSGEFGEVNFFPNWRGENPVRDLTRIFRVPAALENDADAAALGEAAWGAGRHKKRLIYVTIGTGIGAGLVFDGQLYRGIDDSHPEIGHHLIDPSGPECVCGFRGCWESLAAGPSLVRWVEEHAPPEYPHRTQLTAKRICQLAQAGDAIAMKVVAREGLYLGLGLANLVTLYAPDALVLGGSLMKSAPLFLDRIREVISQNCKLVPYEKAELLLASLGDDSNLIGAARVWYHRFAAKGGCLA
jgi:glucokinase